MSSRVRVGPHLDRRRRPRCGGRGRPDGHGRRGCRRRRGRRRGRRVSEFSPCELPTTGRFFDLDSAVPLGKDRDVDWCAVRCSVRGQVSIARQRAVASCSLLNSA